MNVMQSILLMFGSPNRKVIGVVATYQELTEYDTRHLTEGCAVIVMRDETHEYKVSCYEWNENNSEWDFFESSYDSHGLDMRAMPDSVNTLQFYRPTM